MRVFIAGASGLIGGRLIQFLRKENMRVLALSRNPSKAAAASFDSGIEWALGDPGIPGDWMKQLDGCHVAVNLAGEPVVGKRWNAEVKRRIRDSRVETARNLSRAIREAASPPKVFVSSSAAGYYGESGMEAALDEESQAGEGFLADLCQEWESSALEAAEIARVAMPRISVVLAAHGGALKQMLPFFRLGLGGPIGNGKQPFPWIHIDDMASLIVWAIKNEQVSGPINACAPQGLTNAEFSTALGHALHRPALFPVPAFMLQLLYGEGAQVAVKGQNMKPEKLQRMGFTFQFPTVEKALSEILGG